MEISNGSCQNFSCRHHFHPTDSIFVNGESQLQSEAVGQHSVSSEGHVSVANVSHDQGHGDTKEKRAIASGNRRDEQGVRKIIRNFTPS